VLHKHLDNVSSQAARIRQTADLTVDTPGEGENTDGTDSKLSELRAVINYLRKEKEIVDMQLELGKQENGRFKTQIGYLTRDLEDTRATLSDVSNDYPLDLITPDHPLFYRSGSALHLQPGRTRNTQNLSRRSSS
jgi:hypothetical protein